MSASSENADGPRPADRVILAGTFFLSAFLLFSVQPLLGKLLLPWFGGAPAVWTTSLLFFQVALLLGYVYSHLVVARIGPKAQSVLHLIVLAGSLAALGLLWWLWGNPLFPGPSWRPQAGQQPVTLILAVLALGVGAQFLVLSTTTSLLQSWYTRLAPRRSPYRYFALSNLGSLAALVLYPLLVEAFLPVGWQTRLWVVGYALFAIGCGYTALRARNATRSPETPVEREQQAGRVGRLRLAMWIALPACASLLLVAITNQMTQDIAAVPLLWVLPLMIYLVSLVACFASERVCSRWWAVALFAAIPVYAVLLVERNDLHIALQLVGYCTVLLAVCMACHGELVRLRPAPARLTSFYLCIALGGALGSAFVALVAPLAFDDFHELPLGLALAWILVFVSWLLDKSSVLYGRRTLPVTFTVALALAGLGVVSLVRLQSDRTMLESRRSFFGVFWIGQLRSLDPSQTMYAMGHGVTVHGTQIFDDQRRREPTTYYGPDSGVGLTLLELPRRKDGFRVGVIGLGVGTLATYGTEGDVFRFYELNPDVIEFARGQGSYFSFLASTPATVEIIEGDARLSMELEAERNELQDYDVLVLDAFSSHSIPVHLLTRECFETYLKHLTQDGVIAAHIGNPHVDLQPVLARLAEHFGLEVVLAEHRGDDHVRYDSQWVLLTRDKRFFEIPGIKTKIKALQADPDDSPLWTDDYTNPLALMY